MKKGSTVAVACFQLIRLNSFAMLVVREVAGKVQDVDANKTQSAFAIAGLAKKNVSPRA